MDRYWLTFDFVPEFVVIIPKSNACGFGAKFVIHDGTIAPLASYGAGNTYTALIDATIDGCTLTWWQSTSGTNSSDIQQNRNGVKYFWVVVG